MKAEVVKLVFTPGPGVLNTDLQKNNLIWPSAKAETMKKNLKMDGSTSHKSST